MNISNLIIKNIDEIMEYTISDFKKVLSKVNIIPVRVLDVQGVFEVEILEKDVNRFLSSVKRIGVRIEDKDLGRAGENSIFWVTLL